MAASKTEIDELNCPICQESYNDNERNPRILMCGHTFCSFCLKNLIINSYITCPDCRNINLCPGIESLPICYIIKKIADSLKSLNISQIEENHLTIVNGQLPYFGQCKLHNSPNYFYCETCLIWVCGTCGILEHQKPESYCKLTFINEAAHIFIKKEFQILDLNKKILNDILLFINELVEKTNEKLIKNYQQMTFLDRISYSRSADELKKFLSDKSDEVEELLDIFEDSIIALKEISKPYTIQNLSKLKQGIENLWSCQGDIKNPEGILGEFWKKAQYGEKVMWSVANMNIKYIFIHELDDAKLQAECEYADDYLVVKCLKKENLISSIRSVYFHLSDLFIEGMYTFMDLADGDEFLGTVVFKLFETSRSRHFRLLFTGEMGQSYLGSRFFEKGGVHNQYLQGGDYEYNNGTGGKAVSDVSNDDISETLEAGFVCGLGLYNKSKLTQYRIFYKVDDGYFTAKGLIAKVICGLPIINRIASHDYSSVIVEECGLLFYTEGDDG